MRPYTAEPDKREMDTKPDRQPIEPQPEPQPDTGRKGEAMN